MGLPLDGLRRNVLHLERTWKTWFRDNGKDKERRKALEENIEYLLAEAKTFLGYFEKEWRAGSPKPRRRPKYDHRVKLVAQ